MEEKMEPMKANHVWNLVDLQQGWKAIENNWVLKIKIKADGTIDRYKIRLEAKGYTQQEHIDYEKFFSHVARFISIRLILAMIT